MIVYVEIPPETQKALAEAGARPDRLAAALPGALLAAVTAGADSVVEQLVTGQLGLTMRHPASGLAASTRGWMIDESTPLGAVGVPSDTPAAKYAAMLEHGGEIRPAKAKALAIPISPEARGYTSPRDMAGLFMVKRRGGKPPLLARAMGNGAIQPHWVLVAGVTIPAFHWLSRGVNAALEIMADAFGAEVSAALEEETA